MKQGANFERQLRKRLWDEGFVTVRAAGSGSTKFPCPDLVAINSKVILLIEAKSYKDPDAEIDLRKDWEQSQSMMQIIRGVTDYSTVCRETRSIVVLKEDGKSGCYWINNAVNSIVPSNVDNRLYEILNRYRA